MSLEELNGLLEVGYVGLGGVWKLLGGGVGAGDAEVRAELGKHDGCRWWAGMMSLIA